jgi:hypothetical protein
LDGALCLGRVPYVEKCTSEHNNEETNMAEEMWVGYRDYMALFFPGSFKVGSLLFSHQLTQSDLIVNICGYSLVGMVSKHPLFYSL